MAFQNSQKGQSTLAEINVVPLVDIMLVLLVIFMVTAPFLNESIDVDLPEVTAASASTEKRDKIIVINQQGDVFIEGEDKTPYTLETLGPALQQIFAGDGAQEKTLFLRADKNVPYGTVVKIMALAKQLGIARIGMITEPESS
jgi:biopolymer transport protein TolR